MTVIEVLEALKQTPGSLDKKNIIKENQSPTLTQIFHDTYDESRKYNVKKYMVIESLFEPLSIIDNYHIFHNALDYLAEKKVTGNDAVNLIGRVIGQFNTNERWILDGILKRNLKVGVSLDNFNDAMGIKSIFKYEVALADKFFDLKPKDQDAVVTSGEYMASQKLDGCVDYYCNVEFEDGTVLPIGDVVKNKIKGNIKSFDGRKIVYKPIINWFEGLNDVDKSQKQWYEIKTSDGKIIKITGNDRLMTKRGWKRVDELTKNDEIMI